MKKQAEDDCSRKVKGGADFAALANKLSEDEVSTTKGGDLDFFGNGEMVKEFDDAAVRAQARRQISDLVKTQFGYHIIKVSEKKAGDDAVARRGAAQIEDIAQGRAGAEGSPAHRDRPRRQAAPSRRISTPSPRAAASRSPSRRFFARDDPPIRRPRHGAGGRRARVRAEDRARSARRSASQQGFAFVTVTGTQDASRCRRSTKSRRACATTCRRRRPSRPRVRRPRRARGAAESAGDFNAAAKAAGLEAKTTDLIARGAPSPTSA